MLGSKLIDHPSYRLRLYCWAVAHLPLR